MSLRCPIGPETNLLEPEYELESRILLDQPVLSLVDFQVVLSLLDYTHYSVIIINEFVGAKASQFQRMAFICYKYCLSSKTWAERFGQFMF